MIKKNSSPVRICVRGSLVRCRRGRMTGCYSHSSGLENASALIRSGETMPSRMFLTRSSKSSYVPGTSDRRTSTSVSGPSSAILWSLSRPRESSSSRAIRTASTSPTLGSVMISKGLTAYLLSWSDCRGAIITQYFDFENYFFAILRAKEKVEPSPSSDSAQIFPPDFSMIWRQIKSPNPVPEIPFVWSFLIR